MRRRLDFYYQIFFGVIFFTIIGVFANNLLVNLIRTGMGFSLSWLSQPSGFLLSESVLNYKPSDSYAWLLFLGWLNSLKVILFSLIIASFMGLLAGVSRLSKNLLLNKLSSLYVGLVRQVPLLLQLFFWYFVVFLRLSEKPIEIFNKTIVLSNQGLNIFGLTVSLEFSALLVGLSVFTGASISEVIRGGLLSVQKGQWEAFRSLGISERLGMAKIIIPQSLPAIIPGLTSQYLNLAKNSTLAIAVGYADIYAVSDTTITQTGRAVEGFLILLTSFLILNILISWTMELLNKYVMKKIYH